MKKNERTEQDYRDAASKSFSIAGMCRELGLGAFGANYRRIHKAIEKYNINISHFTGQGWNVGLKFKPYKKYSLEEILIENSTYDSTNTLKNRLLNENVKEYICERCGRTEWEGEKIPLQLHHINGERSDNRLENLQLLCPNCHALTDNYCGRNKNSATNKKNELARKEKIANETINKFIISKKRKEKLQKNITKKEKVKKYCKYCGKELKKSGNEFCDTECYNAYRTENSKRPNVLELIDVLKKNSGNKSAVARYYGVSEQAVRKWIKLYKI